MTETTEKKGYVARHMGDVEPTPCPCGSAVRIITSRDTPEASFHVTTIRDSVLHYHKKTTEIYHILEGSGVLEIAGDSVELTPGMTVLIKKGTPHRGYGDFKTVVTAIPAFDPEDEYFPENG